MSTTYASLNFSYSQDNILEVREDENTKVSEECLLVKADVKNIMCDATDKHRNQLMPGYMDAFYYDPKHKATLPYYDKFPLIFPLSVGKDFFIGINFR